MIIQDQFLTRAGHFQNYFYDVFKNCSKDQLFRYPLVLSFKQVNENETPLTISILLLYDTGR